MNLQTMLNQFNSTSNETNQQSRDNTSAPMQAIGSMIPGGLAGGAAAGGVMALLMGSKSSRKMAKKVAKLGGAAVLGGIAYKAYDGWRKKQPVSQIEVLSDVELRASSKPKLMPNNETNTQGADALSVTLVKAMIAASKADGHIDTTEQMQLFSAIERLELKPQQSQALKAQVFDLMNKDISVEELANEVTTEEERAEVYLAAFLAIDVDTQKEREFLSELGNALLLPSGFPAYLERHATLD